MKLARFLLRVIVGSLFVGHGTQKLFGWFGGYGIDATAQAFEGMGMRPGRRNAIAAGAAEAGGGAALALGFATPTAGAALIATMLTAIHRVHFKNGPWVTNGGFEYNLVLIAAILTAVELARVRSPSMGCSGSSAPGHAGHWPPSPPPPPARSGRISSRRPSPRPRRPRRPRTTAPPARPRSPSPTARRPSAHCRRASRSLPAGLALAGGPSARRRARRSLGGWASARAGERQVPGTV